MESADGLLAPMSVESADRFRSIRRTGTTDATTANRRASRQRSMRRVGRAYRATMIAPRGISAIPEYRKRKAVEASEASTQVRRVVRFLSRMVSMYAMNAVDAARNGGLAPEHLSDRRERKAPGDVEGGRREEESGLQVPLRNDMRQKNGDTDTDRVEHAHPDDRVQADNAPSGHHDRNAWWEDREWVARVRDKPLPSSQVEPR